MLHRIIEQGKRYIVARPDGRVLVGSTEEDAGFDKRTTALAVGELLAFGLTLVPALADAQVERTWAGLRPGTKDGLPFLGPVPGLENLFVAAGLWGLAETAPYLHDGRAPTVHDAIVRHGGEATAARDAYLALDEPARASVRVFLASLSRQPKVFVP